MSYYNKIKNLDLKNSLTNTADFNLESSYIDELSPTNSEDILKDTIDFSDTFPGVEEQIKLSDGVNLETFLQSEKGIGLKSKLGEEGLKTFLSSPASPSVLKNLGGIGKFSDLTSSEGIMDAGLDIAVDAAATALLGPAGPFAVQALESIGISPKGILTDGLKELNADKAGAFLTDLIGSGVGDFSPESLEKIQGGILNSAPLMGDFLSGPNGLPTGLTDSTPNPGDVLPDISNVLDSELFEFFGLGSLGGDLLETPITIFLIPTMDALRVKGQLPAKGPTLFIAPKAIVSTAPNPILSALSSGSPTELLSSVSSVSEMSNLTKSTNIAPPSDKGSNNIIPTFEQLVGGTIGEFSQNKKATSRSATSLFGKNPSRKLLSAAGEGSELPSVEEFKTLPQKGMDTFSNLKNQFSPANKCSKDTTKPTQFPKPSLDMII